MLLHGERDRALLRDGARGAGDRNDVSTWAGAGVSPAGTSASTTITAPAATEYTSNDAEKQNEHSRDDPTSSRPSWDTNEQDARKSSRFHRCPG
jgi:hypothetical protein